MPRFCAVVGCSNRSNRETNKRFFGFPSIRDNRGRKLSEGLTRRRLWLQALKRADLSENKLRCASICSDHFLQGEPAGNGQLEHPDYIPSQNLGYVTSKAPSLVALQRFDRMQKMCNTNKGRDVDDGSTNSQPLENDNNTDNQGDTTEIDETLEAEIDGPVLTMVDKSTQTEAFNDTLLHEELYQLRDTLKRHSYSSASFKDDDDRTRYFTALPTFKAMMLIFGVIEPYIKISARSVVQDKFLHFIITLMKLRLNLDFKFLSYIFLVSESTISRIFYSTVEIMYYRFKGFIIWPGREELISSMPECFTFYFGNKVTIIIDCFEVKCQKATNLEAQATTWSNYKHSNTIKVLIGITPQGSISYISDGYGGRISDKEITEDCGILNNLLPGDLVLADRGFLIEDLVGLHMATVKTPAFLKGRKQLDPTEVEETRHTANVRIHVERVIGTLRSKFTCLSSVLPIRLLMQKNGHVCVLDQILVVCSAIVNLCPSIVT